MRFPMPALLVDLIPSEFVVLVYGIRCRVILRGKQSLYFQEETEKVIAFKNALMMMCNYFVIKFAFADFSPIVISLKKATIRTALQLIAIIISIVVSNTYFEFKMLELLT